MRPNLLILAFFLGTACSDSASGPAPPRPAPLAQDLEYTAPEGTLAYAWDEGPSVPLPQGAGRKIPFGEAGVTRDTRLYLPMSEGIGGTTADASPNAVPVELRNTAWGPGRFGQAIELSSESSSLRVRSKTPPLFRDQWTFELWFNPPPAGKGGRVARAPGVFNLELDRNGHAVLEVQTTPPIALRSRAAARRGEWNFLACVLDGPEITALRMVLNGDPQVMRYEQKPAAVGTELVLGGDPQGGMGGWIDEVRVRSSATPTKELIERWTEGPEVGMHRLAIEKAQGKEQVQLWAHPLTEPVVDDQEAWSHGTHEHTLAVDGRLRWVPGHWEEIPAEKRPLARTTHPTVYIGDHRVFLWGGETRDTHLSPMVNTDDTWIFRTDSLEWERVFTEIAPDGACHQPAAYSPDHKVVLYAGGWRNDTKDWEEFSSTWLYYTEEGRWERREPKGHAFPATSNCGIYYDPILKEFLVFRAGRGRVLAFDPDKNRWKLWPMPRYLDLEGDEIDYSPGGSFMVGYDPEREHVLIFGGGLGLGEQSYQDITAIFDPKENSYTVLEPDTAPDPRVRSGFAYDTKRKHFVLFGGVLGQFSERKTDLWVFDPGTGQWQEHLASNTPSARGGYYGMAYDPDVDRFFLLCGRHAPEIFLDEVQSLHFDPTAWGRAEYVFDRRAFPQESEWFARWKQPGKSIVSFRFRASQDGVRWDSWNEDIAQVAKSDARFVQVAITLRAGAEGEVPELYAMGFGTDPGDGAFPESKASSSTVEALR